MLCWALTSCLLAEFTKFLTCEDAVLFTATIISCFTISVYCLFNDALTNSDFMT